MAGKRKKKMTAVQEVRLCDFAWFFPLLEPADQFRYRVFQLHTSALVAIPIGPDAKRRHRLAIRFLLRLSNIQEWNPLERRLDRALKAAGRLERRISKSPLMRVFTLGPRPKLP